MNNPTDVSLSPMDEARFGVRTAKAKLNSINDVAVLREFCIVNDVQFAIVRCPTLDAQIAQALEKDDFFLTDTLVYFRCDLDKIQSIPIEDGVVNIRSVQPGDETSVGQIAAEAFHDFRGHYHADPYLDRAKCDEVYVDWAVRSCISRDVADDVLIAEFDKKIIGFTTLRMESAEIGTTRLTGVATAAQKQGVYRCLQAHGINWCKNQGARWLITSTTVSNVPVQKVWVRRGYEPHASEYTFHKWFRKS